MIALLALTLAPLAHILCLLRPIRRAVQVLHMVHQLVVVLRRTPRAISPLALGLRIFPNSSIDLANTTSFMEVARGKLYDNFILPHTLVT